MLEFFGNLIKGSFIYGLGSLAGPIVGFFLLPVYTRFLAPSDYGILETLTTTTYMLTVLLISGMDNSLFRFSFDSSDEPQRKRVLATTSVFLWGLAIFVTTILVLNAAFLSQLIFHSPDYVILLDIAFLSAGLAAVYKIPMIMLRIHNQPARYAAISAAQTLLTALLCIFFVVALKQGVLGMMSGTIIATTAATLVAYYLVRNHLSFNSSFNLLKSMLNFAVPVMPAGLSLWILSLSNRYFLFTYSTTTELGIYSVGAKFVSVVSLAVGAFALAWPQAAFSILDQDNKDRIYARAMTYFVFVSCSIVLVLSLFSSELVTLMTTKEFFPGARVIPILALGSVFSGCYTIFAIGMNITKKMRMIFPVTAVPAGFSLILNYFLIPPYGMMGAAWATLISYMLMAFLSWWASERVYHMDYEWKNLGKIFGVMIVVFAISKVAMFDQLYYSVPIKLSLLAAFFFALKYLLKLPIKEGWGSLQQTLAGLIPRLH